MTTPPDPRKLRKPHESRSAPPHSTKVGAGASSGWLACAFGHLIVLADSLPASFGGGAGARGRRDVNEMMSTPRTTAETSMSAPLFHADTPGGPSLGDYRALDLLADLATHAQTQTPLTIGVFGAPGAGKSHALRSLARRARGLTAAAGEGGPFLTKVLTIEMDARALLGDAASGLANALHGALLAQGPDSPAARLDAKALEAATDPQAAALEAARKLDDTAQRVASEQRVLDELKLRRAGLNDALLSGSTTTQVEDYARRHRKQLEVSLKSFGFTGDAAAVYKDLLRELAERPGRLGAFANSIWSYAGQAKLLIWAIALFLLAYALGLAERTSTDWLTGLRNAAEGAKDPANWIEGHTHWLTRLGNAAITAGLICLALNIWRAARFTMPLLQGLRLLEEDAGKRRSELDDMIGRQGKRLDQLGAEAQKLAAIAHSNEIRARQPSALGAPHRHNLFATPEAQAPGLDAGGYLAAIAAGLGAQDAPRRILVLLDGLEALSAPQAASLVDTVHDWLDRPGFVLAMAADPDQLTAGWGGAKEAARRLERHVQAPFNIRMIRDQQASIAYAHQLLGAAPETPQAPPDASTCALDQALKPIETHLLGKLASLAGDTPRAVKRYLNAWRLARPMTSDSGALALMLALDNGATAGELAAMGAAMDLEEPGKPLVIHPGEPRLAAALGAVNALRSSPLTNGQAHAAWMIARDYSLPSA